MEQESLFTTQYIYIPHELCDCSPPFELFCFPTKLKEQSTCEKWIRLINRSESSRSSKLCSPKKGSRVCISNKKSWL